MVLRLAERFRTLRAPNVPLAAVAELADSLTVPRPTTPRGRSSQDTSEMPYCPINHGLFGSGIAGQGVDVDSATDALAISQIDRTMLELNCPYWLTADDGASGGPMFGWFVVGESEGGYGRDASTSFQSCAGGRRRLTVGCMAII